MEQVVFYVDDWLYHRKQPEVESVLFNGMHTNEIKGWGADESVRRAIMTLRHVRHSEAMRRPASCAENPLFPADFS